MITELEYVLPEKPKFGLTVEEVAYIVKNIQHEYLNKDTYYFASDLFGRMEKFLVEQGRNDVQSPRKE
jgi:hypothetical protein